MGEEVWLRVGEVARRTGLTVRTLHHYDATGLVTPSARSGNGYRAYSPDDLRRLLAVQQLKALGLSLDEIGAALDAGSTPAAVLAEHTDALEARILAEQELLQRLRRLAAGGLDDWGDVVAAIALTERLRDPDPTVRLRAALDAPHTAPLDDLLDELGRDPHDSVRETLTWAVVQRGADATAALVARLNDPAPLARLQYAHALSKLRDPAAVGPLVPLLDDPEPRVARKAAFALGQIGGAEAMRALAARLGTGDDEFRDAVTSALGKLGPDATGEVAGALEAADPRVREQAADVLATLADPAAVPALALRLDDPSDDVAFAAALALGATPGPAATVALERAQTAGDPRVRAVAQRFLAGRS